MEDFKKYSFYQQYFLKNFQRPKDIRSSSRQQRSFEANKGQPTKQAKFNISQEATRNSAGRSSPKRKQPKTTIQNGCPTTEAGAQAVQLAHGPLFPGEREGHIEPRAESLRRRGVSNVTVRIGGGEMIKNKRKKIELVCPSEMIIIHLNA